MIACAAPMMANGAIAAWVSSGVPETTPPAARPTSAERAQPVKRVQHLALDGEELAQQRPERRERQHRGGH